MDVVFKTDSSFNKEIVLTVDGVKEQKESTQNINHSNIILNAKVDKSDPRSNQHFVKLIKHRGVTVKLWECSICGREFQHQYMLRRHLPGHTDERNYHCLVCGKSFRQLSTLSQHRTIHSLARPHSCMICGKNFNRISTLISHRKTHLDEKPYKCHICCKGFHQKGNLRNHLFSHTNERPYRCSLCNKGFNQQSNLTCHMKKVHPGNEKATTKIIPPAGFPQPSVPTIPPVDIPFSVDVNSNGIIVEPIKTTEMEEILKNGQVPFALLKHNGSRPVLVKIFTSNVPEGKQMLVPVTAQDLMNGGKLIFGPNENGENYMKEYFDVTSPLLHLQVPLAAILDSQISADGQHNIIVHPPTTFSELPNSTTDYIKVEDTNVLQENNLFSDVMNHTTDYNMEEIGNQDEKMRKFKKNKLQVNRTNNILHPMDNASSKDPVLNDIQQIGEGSGLIRPPLHFESSHHLLDPHGPPSYATDYDCRNLELFESLDYIETGKMKSEMSPCPAGDIAW